MEGAGKAMKGKRKFGDFSCGNVELKPPLKCLVKLDFEEADLPIWKDAAARRGGYYQHIRDAPKLLRDLVAWLEKVKFFERSTKLRCPNYADVRAMVGPAWMGRWTPKALLAFQAVANSSGIMHPPRKDSVVPKWRTQATFTGRSVLQAHCRRGRTPLVPPPSPNINKESPALGALPVGAHITSADPTPPSTPCARAIPSRGTNGIRLAGTTGGVPIAPTPANVGRMLRLLGPISPVPDADRNAGGTSHTPLRRTPNIVAAEPGNRGNRGAQCPGPSVPRRFPDSAGVIQSNVVVLSDDSVSEGSRMSTAAVHGSMSSDNEEAATTSVGTQESAIRTWALRLRRVAPNKVNAKNGDYKGKKPM